MGKSRPIRALLLVALVPAILAITPAGASAAASATTGAATELTSSSAVLGGSAMPGAAGSSYYFEYGTTTTYGQSTPHIDFTASGSVSASITGLLPGTTYHYQLFVQDPSSTSPVVGGDMTFTTPTVATATTGQATSITTTSASLNGVANTADPNASAFFQYGRTSAYGHSTAPQSIAPGLTLLATKITGLTPHTPYHFRLVVQQSNAPTVDGADASFTTAVAYGHAALRTRRLRVEHGFAATSFSCTGFRGAACKAQVSLTTRAKTGKRRFTTVGCGKTPLSTTATHRKTIHFKLGPRCGSLLHSARGHRLGATLLAAFSTHQPSIRTGVTLLGS